MADYVVTSTADSGSGTLREALAQIQNGEIITFDDSLEDANGIIIITLAADSAALSIPAYQFTIDGGGHTGSGETLQTRVVIDAAANENDKRRVAYINSGCKAVVKNITFTNGYIIGLTSTNAWGGCIWFNTSSTSSPSFEFCVFKNCQAYQGGAFGSNGRVSYTVSDSLFKSNSANNSGGGIFCQMSSSSQNLISLYNDTFISNTSRNGGGISTYNYANMIVDSCVFSGNISTATTIQSADINITSYTTCVIKNTRAESTSSNNININNSTVTITNLTTTSVILDSTATIIFTGVDSVLAVTTTATIGSATFTAAENSTGYLALPVGATAPTVGNGVIVCTYGAGIQSASLSKTNVSWTATNLSTDILIEQLSGNSWTTLTTSGTGGSYSGPFGEGTTVRLFDGVAFYYASTQFPYWVVNSFAVTNNDWIVTSYAISTNGGGGTDPGTGDPLPYWTITTDDITPNF